MPDPKTRPSSKKAAQAVNLDAIGLEMGKKPPQALDVEEAVLGAMLLEPSSVDIALEELTEKCFYDERHAMIFRAISSLVNEHSPVDIVTVSNKLRSTSDLETVGGPVYLANLSQQVGAAANVEFYVRILKQKTVQRDLISASHEILKQAYDDSVNVDDLIDIAETRVYEASQGNIKKDVQEIGSVISDAMKQIEAMQSLTGLSGVPSGFLSIDSITQGWQPSDLIILAARPSVGKTAFALNLARNAAVQHHMPVAIFSLEMSASQLAKRMMTSESGLSADKIKGGTKLEPFEWEQLEVKLKNLIAAPIYIDDTPSIPVNEFRTKVKNLVKNKKVRMVIVDYLQLMQGPAELRGMREQEVAAISRNLKATAKELNIPILALSQLSRNAVQRSGGSGKPQLSDLRESGSIEQDADMVLFIHRPDAIGLAENPEDREVTQIIIAKHRNGQTGEIPMIFKSEQIRFMEVDQTLSAQAVASAMNDDNDRGDFDSPYSPFE
ncbi:MAG: replicative DNA helicase [Bacteroidales bacterium]|nr:replicative DNA helicase [Bacteroidales bacterium]